MGAAMTAVPRPFAPPVECAPWCENGDGHPTTFTRDDQKCWSRSQYIKLSLEPPVREADGEYPQTIGAMARREADGSGHVYVHLDGIKLSGASIPWPYNILDHCVQLTAAEAEELAEVLRKFASLVRSPVPQAG